MTKLQRPDAIFFDLDETLIDNTRPVAQLFLEVFAVHQPAAVRDGQILEPVLQALREQVGTLWQGMFDLTERDLVSAMFDRTLRYCEQHCDIGIDVSASSLMARQLEQIGARAIQPRSGALQVLEALRARGVALGIITNGIASMQMAKVRQLALHQWVDTVVVSEMAGAHKPDAKVFAYALEKIGVAAMRAWHVGDHPLNDVTGAKRSGMSGILYAPDENDAGRFEACTQSMLEPDHRARHLLEILDLFETGEAS
ncbi:MAG: HAD family hydrolase [Pseudomonadales bacterium]